MSQDLSGRVVVITGGARGIGAATARQFADAGAVVAVGDLDERALDHAAAAGATRASVLDVTDIDGFAAFIADTEAALGPVAVMVNNAGIMPTGWFSDEPAALSRRILEINLLGVIHGTQLALQSMLPRSHGHIVNVASIVGVSYGAGVATYCASKHGVVSFTDCVRCELRGRGVSISPVLPMMVQTDMIKGARILPGMRPVTPEAVGRAIVESVGKPRRRIYVPRSGVVMAGMTRFLPTPLNDAVSRRLGLDRVFLDDVDDAARESYHRRVRSDL